ncbi:MAG: AbrB/MazE/SpoVT family DNA-binding domain-containing protein [Acidobacteria bacterium]|nr:AbrB/MazE/SpoVT family DNA-binding domain-containing protein [Acidobacteriota bacterium]
MTTTKLSTKGQLVLPKEVRDRHGWKPGLEIEVIDQGHSILLRPVEEVPETTTDEAFGCLEYDGPPVSIEEMDAGVTQWIRKTWGQEYDDRD